MTEINLLPVGNGDCLHIRISDNDNVHNIVIDSGPGKAKRTFRSLLQHIYNHGEQIDLLCFSHIDDDHIRAAAQVIPEEGFINSRFVRQVWLNVGNETVDDHMQGNTHELSVRNAEVLYIALRLKQIPVSTNIIAGQQYRIGNAVIDILSPDAVRHKKYCEYWTKEIQKRKLAAYPKDTSITNGDSIAFSLTVNDDQYLFLGDAHPDVITEEFLKLTDLYGAKETLLVKLSHHGSPYNLNPDLLQAVHTKHFLVSAGNDSNHFSQESWKVLSSYLPEQEKWVYCNFRCSHYREDHLHLLTLDADGVWIGDSTHIYSGNYEE